MDSILSFMGEHYIVGLLALCIIFGGTASIIKAFMNVEYKFLERRIKTIEAYLFKDKAYLHEIMREKDNESIPKETVSRSYNGKLDG